MSKSSPYQFHADGTIPAAGEIFVFGSNLAGRHGKGAALIAKQRFGASVGIGRGRMGQSYGIATKDQKIQARPLDAIRGEVVDFIAYAKHNDEDRFFITRIGCGLAGYADDQVAPLFQGAPENCSFPLEWAPYLGASDKAG